MYQIKLQQLTLSYAPIGLQEAETETNESDNVFNFISDFRAIEMSPREAYGEVIVLPDRTTKTYLKEQ